VTGVEVRAEHYSAEDRRLLVAAGDVLVAWAADLARHEAADDGPVRWYRTADDDPVLTAGQLGWLVANTTATLRQVIDWYTAATLAAYGRAARDHGRR